MYCTTRMSTSLARTSCYNSHFLSSFHCCISQAASFPLHASFKAWVKAHLVHHLALIKASFALPNASLMHHILVLCCTIIMTHRTSSCVAYNIMCICLSHQVITYVLNWFDTCSNNLPLKNKSTSIIKWHVPWCPNHNINIWFGSWLPLKLKPINNFLCAPPIMVVTIHKCHSSWWLEYALFSTWCKSTLFSNTWPLFPITPFQYTNHPFATFKTLSL